MHPSSKKYTAFLCEFGLFQWTRLPMGLKNSGATFSRAMRKLFEKHIKKFLYIYMDDFVIYSRTPEEHAEHLRIVVEQEIEFLGHLIRDGCIKPSRRKVEALFRYQEPTTVRQLLGFLGLAGHYRKFIEHFAEIAHSLYECASLNKANKRKLREFTDDCRKAFNTRECLADENKVLLLPDLNKIFKLFCDASSFGIGATLTQQDSQGNWRPCSYYSKHLSKTERRYPTSETELMSRVKGTEFHKQFLLGREFILCTDHKPLTWMMTHRNPSMRLARWRVRLEHYTFRMEYRKGNQHGDADGLSRWPLPDQDEEGEDDNDEIIINAIAVPESNTSSQNTKSAVTTNSSKSQTNTRACYHRLCRTTQEK